MLNKRGAGVLMHISSIPSEYGVGVFDENCLSFIDKLKEMDFGYWQVLPFNPVDDANSPYCSSSAFAGNFMFIDPAGLMKEGLVSKADVDENVYAVTVEKAPPAPVSVENLEEGIATFKVTDEPTPTPEPTLPIGITATPTPLPTSTPTPLPTATPVPTELPTKDLYIIYSKRYYFSTDEGYTISKIITNTSNELSSSQNVTGAGTIYSSTYTKRDNLYCKGQDEKGNEWYFIPDGTNATYVHPFLYEGHHIDNEEVKYIKELTFPTTITYEGVSYTVVSIGGGTARYKTKKQGYDGKWNDSGFGYDEEWDYRTECGEYDYYKTSQSSDRTYEAVYYNNISYAYGIVGNGMVESTGSNCYTYKNGTEKEREFERSYYVYNTTLQSITIPDTVTTILPYAFYGCQALTEIKGGDYVLSIEKYAFGATRPNLFYSVEWVENSYRNYKMYYYNESYSMIVGTYTDTMLHWEEACELSAYCRLPKFPILDKIGIYSFVGRRNLYDVILSDSVSTIGNYAFQGCFLNSITIPGMDTQVRVWEDMYYGTLGSNGTGEDRTIIYTIPNSSAMKYGLHYSDYYRLKSGYPVIYESNGSGEEAKSYSSDVIMEEDIIF